MHGMVSDIGPARAGAVSGDADYDRLIQAVARDRDRDAFAALFDHFAPRLKAYLMRAGAAPAAADDFAQDAMLTVWRKAELFDPARARAATWIFTIARNRRIDALRRDARPLPAPEISLASSPEPERPDELLEARQDEGRVRASRSSASGAGSIESSTSPPIACRPSTHCAVSGRRARWVATTTASGGLSVPAA